MSEDTRQIGNDGGNGYLVIGDFHRFNGSNWKLVTSDNNILAGVNRNRYSPVNFFVSEKLLMFGDGNILFVTDDPTDSIASIQKFKIRNLHSDYKLACSLRDLLEDSGFGLMLESHK